MTTFGNIPTKTFKQSSKCCSDTLENLFKNALKNGYFPDKLECADAMSVFKKSWSNKSKEL